jgi:hypothetical protein
VYSAVLGEGFDAAAEPDPEYTWTHSHRDSNRSFFWIYGSKRQQDMKMSGQTSGYYKPIDFSRTVQTPRG